MMRDERIAYGIIYAYGFRQVGAHLRMTAQQLYDSPHGESLPPPFSHHSSIFPDGDGIYNMMILITFDDSMFFSVSKNFN